jgi:outer membrane protein assembly factor BamD (BamD/ComL family)
MTRSVSARAALAFVVSFLVLLPAFAQTGGTTGGGTTGGTGGTTSGTTGKPTRPTSVPGTTNQQQQPLRPTFLSGQVVMDDGSPVPHGISIERVCNARARREAYADTSGGFSFQVGQEQGIMQDASDMGNGSSIPGFASTDINSVMQGTSGHSATGELNLSGCELRASMPGYRSSTVDLSQHRSLDSPDVGTIVLSPLGRVQGTTISAISEQAPKEAKKEYEKGLNAAKKAKFDEAQQHFRESLRIYPKHAGAWLELGLLLQRQNNRDEARKAYEQAMAVDPKYVNPQLQLASLAADQHDWKRVAELTDSALQLDPIDFPSGFFLNAVAHYNLGHMDVAERSALRAQKLDPGHHLTQVELLLGRILIAKKDYPGAITRMNAYLQLYPNAEDANDVRKQVSALEQMRTASK